MLWRKQKSINTKLRLLVMTAVTTALLLSYVAFVVNDVRIMKNSMVRQLMALADVLGTNCTAAITFDDDTSAGQILASLRVQPAVEAACIYKADGDIFAKYETGEAESAFPSAPDAAGHRFNEGHLHVSQPIVENGERLGAIYIRGSLAPIRDEMLSYAAITAIVLVISFVASYLLASRLQRGISGPILGLAETAERVSKDQDFSIRVSKASEDELGILYDQFNRMLEQIETSKRELQRAHDQLEQRVDERTRQLSIANDELSGEVAERRKAERQLEDAHRELMAAARRAGMAEIASGVLHNVGNVLNSVNVSANLVAEHLRSSKGSQLMSLATLLNEQGANVGEFLKNDERGKRVPELLSLIARNVQEHDASLLEEVNSLTANVEHIKTIVSTQQSYTRAGGLVEPTDVAALLDDAVRLNSASFERHKIQVVREYADLPPVLLDRQRLLQIVINLVKNAKEALVEQQSERRVMTLRTRAECDRLLIEVSDSGAGIKKEDLTRIFTHGFTTKSGGHGFGLHSSANAAAEMDGSLTASSDGPMRGATFRLNLPLAPAPVIAT
jgi:signal transduction histidine kinase